MVWSEVEGSRTITVYITHPKDCCPVTGNEGMRNTYKHIHTHIHRRGTSEDKYQSAGEGREGIEMNSLLA